MTTTSARRRHHFRWVAALFALGFVLACSPGCRATLPSYALRSAKPNKDVLVVSVTLDSRLDAEAYLRIVELEMPAAVSRAKTDDIEVYEVRFEFLMQTDDAHLGHQRVSEVVLYATGEGESPATGTPTLPPPSSSNGLSIPGFSKPQVVLY